MEGRRNKKPIIVFSSNVIKSLSPCLVFLERNEIWIGFLFFDLWLSPVRVGSS